MTNYDTLTSYIATHGLVETSRLTDVSITTLSTLSRHRCRPHTLTRQRLAAIGCDPDGWFPPAPTQPSQRPIPPTLSAIVDACAAVYPMASVTNRALLDAALGELTRFYKIDPTTKATLLRRLR
jgi:hypothetical protein